MCVCVCVCVFVFVCMCARALVPAFFECLDCFSKFSSFLEFARVNVSCFNRDTHEFIYYGGGLNTNGEIIGVHIECKISCFRI